MLKLFAFAFFWTAFAAEDSNFSLPEEVPGYEGKPNEGQVYFAEDGSCGWWDDESKKYVQPTLKYQPFNFKCLNEFHWHAYGPACGDPYYEYAKYCAMVKFYENKTPEKWLTPKNKDMLLVLIDGCLVCDEEAKSGGSAGTIINPRDVQIEATITLKHTWAAGSLFTTCAETNRTASETYVQLGKAPMDISEKTKETASISREEEESITLWKSAGEYHYGSFTFAAALFQRRCRGLFSTDPVPDTYQNLILTVEHNCKGIKGNREEMVIHLPDMDTKQFKNNWAEARGLYIDLTKGVAKQYSYVAFSYNDLGTNADAVQWFNTVEKEDDGF